MSRANDGFPRKATRSSIHVSTDLHPVVNQAGNGVGPLGAHVALEVLCLLVGDKHLLVFKLAIAVPVHETIGQCIPPPTDPHTNTKA